MHSYASLTVVVCLRMCVSITNIAARGCSDDLSHAMAALDADASISALVLTGSEKAFAAGADIKEMAPKSYMVRCNRAM